METNKDFYDVNDVVSITGKSESYAYNLIKKLNEELSNKGFFTIRGRISKQYFQERFYGIRKEC